jgi:hypothetical protein
MYHRQINAAGQIVASLYGGGPAGTAQDFLNNCLHDDNKFTFLKSPAHLFHLRLFKIARSGTLDLN